MKDMGDMQRHDVSDEEKTRSKVLPRELLIWFNCTRPRPIISLHMSRCLGKAETKGGTCGRRLGVLQLMSGRFKSPKKQRGMLGYFWSR